MVFGYDNLWNGNPHKNTFHEISFLSNMVSRGVPKALETTQCHPLYLLVILKRRGFTNGSITKGDRDKCKPYSYDVYFLFKTTPSPKLMILQDFLPELRRQQTNGERTVKDAANSGVNSF